MFILLTDSETKKSYYINSRYIMAVQELDTINDYGSHDTLVTLANGEWLKVVNDIKIMMNKLREV